MDSHCNFTCRCHCHSISLEKQVIYALFSDIIGNICVVLFLYNNFVSYPIYIYTHTHTHTHTHTQTNTQVGMSHKYKSKLLASPDLIFSVESGCTGYTQAQHATAIFPSEFLYLSLFSTSQVVCKHQSPGKKESSASRDSLFLTIQVVPVIPHTQRECMPNNTHGLSDEQSLFLQSQTQNHCTHTHTHTHTHRNQSHFCAPDIRIQNNKISKGEWRNLIHAMLKILTRFQHKDMKAKLGCKATACSCKLECAYREERLMAT